MVGWGMGQKNTTALGIFLFRHGPKPYWEALCNRQSVESLMTSAEFRELALMTSEDFDGRLHTYTIGIKLELGPNLHVCNPIARGPRTGPRPIRERLSVNKLEAVEGHLQKGHPRRCLLAAVLLRAVATSSITMMRISTRHSFSGTQVHVVFLRHQRGAAAGKRSGHMGA